MADVPVGRASPKTLVGEDPVLRATVERAVRVAPTRIPVLITGESGTGKELLAELLHRRGPGTGPFVAVNCGTLPRELAESELFGHERGAFTGAGRQKAGWFEEAHGGTLVLDEIGELPADLQPKLLRILDTGRLRRVGGSGEVAVETRVVAMTLRDLRREIALGSFRLDLYHRLAGFELALPPLRQRRADVPLLVEHFLADFSRDLGPRTLDPQATIALLEYDWPGNVRELRNVLRRASVLCPQRITAESLELPLATTYRRTDDMAPRTRAEGHLADADGPPGPPRPALAAGSHSSPADMLAMRGQTFAEIERAVFRWALMENGGSRRGAARSLGLPRSSFCDKVKTYGLV